MTKQIMKKLSLFFVVFTMMFSSFALATTSVSAQTRSADNLLWGDTKDDISDNSGLVENDPRTIAANIIRIILGFLGILAVVLILYGGFLWMTAMGNDDKVKTAKGILVAGVTGLIIILSAFALANFVLDAIFDATS